MGVNAHGLFVGLTNRVAKIRREDARSRGLLVVESLARPDAAAVAREIANQMEQPSQRYNPFHLLAADGRESFLAVLGEGTARLESLEPGIHVVCNRDPDDPASGKVGAIRAAVQAIDLERPIGQVFMALQAVLAGHPDPSNPLENPCVHTQEYGTRSSTLMALGGKRWLYWHAEGAPCETKYSNFTRLLDEVRQAPPIRIT